MNKFKTGAMRESKTGKGRFDLLPTVLLEPKYHIHNIQNALYPDLADFILLLYTKLIKNLKEMPTITSDIDMHKNNLNILNLDYTIIQNILPSIRTIIAIHMQNGADKHGGNNWRKGIPLWSYFDSGIRHFFSIKKGTKEEENPFENAEHTASFLWNTFCLYETFYQIIIPNSIKDNKIDLPYIDYMLKDIVWKDKYIKYLQEKLDNKREEK